MLRANPFAEMHNPVAPFTCTYTPNVPELLIQLNCSLALTTYQANKLIFLSPDGPNSMRQLPRDFEKAMGLAIDGNRMALVVKNEVVVLANAPSLAEDYPVKPGFYDRFFVPRAAYFTGEVDIHDLGWDQQNRLWAVNTLFSCLVTIDDQFSFRPAWTPPFIKSLESGDQCHLNGMAMKDGRPKYVTMFGSSTTPKGWRKGVETNGLLMDIESNEIMANYLAMPHSPRIFDNELYCLLSATGQLVKFDQASGRMEEVIRLKGFVRGLAKRGEYIFVGLSKIRKDGTTFRALEITKDSIYCGIEIVHLPSGKNVGHIRYEQTVDEIYDVQVIEDSLRPGVLNHTSGNHRPALHTPDAGFWGIENKG